MKKVCLSNNAIVDLYKIKQVMELWYKRPLSLSEALVRYCLLVSHSVPLDSIVNLSYIVLSKKDF